MIDIIKMFTEGTINWADKLQNDEWFFCKLRQDITKSISPDQAFLLIPDAVRLVLKQDDEHLCIEALELLFKLIRLSDTTEAPPALLENWDHLMNHVSSFGDYQRKKISELRRWYRKDNAV